MAVVLGAALMVVLIGFSRMYLGVHYFSDVLAGYAAGGVWLSALITGAETIRRGKKETQPTARFTVVGLVDNSQHARNSLERHGR